jgi:hypothetical protein
MNFKSIHVAAIGGFLVGFAGILSAFPTWHGLFSTPIGVGGFILQLGGLITALYAPSAKSDPPSVSPRS